MAEVVLSQLSKVFPGGNVALDHVDLNVADGEFVVLVGPSGCGKSTLLRIVAGLEDATGGTVSIGQQMVNNLTPKDRDIAMVFQSYALYPHMTVEQNLGFGLHMRKVPKKEAREAVQDVAHVLSLEALLDRKPKALSGGQRQRVAMGRAMVRHPQVFLMDEPLSNLDAKLRVAMRGELTRLHQQYRTTTLYVTHDQIEAMTLGDRIAVLNAGRLQQIGTPDELYRSPCNVFVAGFIGSPAMNLAHAELASGPDAQLLLRVKGHEWPLTPHLVSRFPTLPQLLGRRLILGLRPSALSVDRGGDAAVPRLDITAVTIESLGSEKNLLFLPPFEVPDVVGDAKPTETELTAMWTASIDPTTTIFPGDRVPLRLDLDAAYLFDADTGLAVPTPAEPAPARPAGPGPRVPVSRSEAA